MMLDSGVDRRPPPARAGLVSRVIAVIGQLVLPVLFCAFALALAWSCRGEAATDLRFLKDLHPSLDPAAEGWLTWGTLLLPVIFFVLNLTNRRYGPALALGAALLAWVFIAGGIVWALHEGLIHSASEIAPPGRAGAFFGAMLLGQIVNVCLFDWFRGIPWWKAPFVAALFGGLTFTVVFHVATGGGLDEEALPRLAALGGLQLIWACFQLVPTGFLRRAIRPCPGYGGA